MSSPPEACAPPAPRPRVDGLAFFAQWLAHRQADAYDPVCAAATRRLYLSIWTLWLRHLASGARDWSEATAIDVHRFLQSLQARRALAPDGRPRRVSEVSRARYWRLLHWVYAHAQQQGLCERLPTEELHEAERPRKLNDDPTLIDPLLWRALPQAFPRLGQCDSYGVRDLAILQLLYDHALSSEEIRAMRMDDLLWLHAAPAPSGAPVGVHIQGSRLSQARDIRFSALQTRFLKAWLQQRQAQPKYRNREWVFLSDRANPLSIRILFHLVSRTIEQASRQTGIPMPLRCGPQVMRNTAIRERLDLGWPVEKIAAYAGLKNRESVWRHARWRPGQGFA